METGLWLVLFIVFLVFELLTLGLSTVWFAAGALAAEVMSLVGLGFALQTAAFFAVSLLLLFFTRPLAKKYINKNTVRTNVDELTGKIVKCSETIDNYNQMGRVIINGTDWMARAAGDDMIIPKDALVQVVEISGVKAIVTPINHK